MAQQRKTDSVFRTWKAAVERLMVAVTFAEAGERQTALNFMGESKRPGMRSRKRERREIRNGNQPTLMV